MNRIVLCSVAALVGGAGWAAVSRAAPPPSLTSPSPASPAALATTRTSTAARARPTLQRVGDLKPDAPFDRSPARIFNGLRSGFHPTVGKALGLPSPDEIEGAEVGAPMRTVHVRLDELRVYDGRSPADALLHEGPVVTRLVRVGGQVQSTLVQSNARGSWETVQMGDRTRATALDRVIAGLSGTSGVDPDSLFLVKIPALGLDFAAYRSGNQLLLASLFDAPAFSLQAGQALAAEQVFASLAAPARQIPTSRR
jgi:hypothetical protein